MSLVIGSILMWLELVALTPFQGAQASSLCEGSQRMPVVTQVVIDANG
jgi:hypothetical protein